MSVARSTNSEYDVVALFDHVRLALLLFELATRLVAARGGVVVGKAVFKFHVFCQLIVIFPAASKTIGNQICRLE